MKAEQLRRNNVEVRAKAIARIGELIADWAEGAAEEAFDLADKEDDGIEWDDLPTIADRITGVLSMDLPEFATYAVHDILVEEFAPLAIKYYEEVTNQGQVAAREGQSIDTNPYPADSQYARTWSAAFKAEQERIERSGF